MKVAYLFLSLLILSPGGLAKTMGSGAQVDVKSCVEMMPSLEVWIEHQVFQGNLLLTKGKKILCQTSVGFADENKQFPVITDSRFPIASLSKPIVATLLLRLQEQGVVNLQDTLEKYLPDLDASWASKVSLHHLLANRSGLPPHFALPAWSNIAVRGAITKTQLLSEIAKLELRFEPGTEYLYTNLGWTLLEAAVEQVSGKGFKQNLENHVVNPLSMSQTGMVAQSESALVEGFRWGTNGGWQVQKQMNMQVFNGGAGLYSTTRDLLKFLTGVHQNVFLHPSSQNLMFSPTTTYGWRIEDIELTAGFRKVVHSYDGQLNAHSSFVYYVPEDQLSLVLLNNTGMGFEHKKALASDLLRAAWDLPESEQLISTDKIPESFALNRSLLENQWSGTLMTLKSKAGEKLQNPQLIYDLAQQLEWSGNSAKAIELYIWLLSHMPENKVLKRRLENLCNDTLLNKPSQSHSCKTFAGTEMSAQNVRVGMSVLHLQDPSRKAWRSELSRPVTTHLFYPTLDENVESLMLGPKRTPFFDAGSAVKVGKPVNGKRPLILMSHGTGGSALQLLWLAEVLVQEGYLVAAVNHHGNTAIEQEKFPEGFLLWWERTRDLQFVHQQLLKDPPWNKRIDAENIAVIGFSLGGYTAVSALGGITDKALFSEYCREAIDDFSCQPQPEFIDVLEAFEKVKDTPQVKNSQSRQHHNYRIPNLKAAVVIAPAVVHAFTPKSLASIKTPTLFVVGNKDKIAPAKPNAAYAHSLLRDSHLHTIINGHHYSFLSQCTDDGKRILAQLCEDPHGVSRKDIHQQAINKILTFLQEHVPKIREK